MREIADWLEKLGMSEYAQRFAENGIDLSVLPDLTDQDLKDIGVLLGHRRKLLRAIAELNNAATTAVPAPPPVMPATAPLRSITLSSVPVPFVAPRRRPQRIYRRYIGEMCGAVIAHRAASEEVGLAGRGTPRRLAPANCCPLRCRGS